MISAESDKSFHLYKMTYDEEINNPSQHAKDKLDSELLFKDIRRIAEHSIRDNTEGDKYVRLKIVGQNENDNPLK